MILNDFYKKYFENNKIFDYKQYKIIVEKLFDTYNSGYEPPKFILNIPKNKLIKYMKSTIIYYEKDEDKILSFTREPVNIEMNRYYNLEKMYEYFGYEKSFYNEKSSNIAIFTKTPIDITEMDINVLNIIGVALDSRKQYDYIRLNKIKNIDKRIFEYENMVRSFFIKIKKCFLDNNFELLFLSAVGLGNFSILCPSLNIDHNKIFNKIFIEIFEDINEKIILWCFSDNLLNIINNKNNMKTCNLYLDDLLLYIYKNNKKYYTYDINKILFINAYDPYSIVGNGNNNDNSLDGYFGRISAMSILCWPFTNPYINYVKM
jgi:hypothetical protein